MGTDIHAIMQVKKRGKWETVEILGISRNYRLFAVLANVRNGCGFAGCITGEAVPFISEPKGLPDDLDFNDEWKESIKLPKNLNHPYDIEATDYWLGDHSHSWLTLKEIQSYDWDMLGKYQGMVHKDTAKELKDNEQPESWCGATNIPDYVTVYWTKPIKDTIGNSFFNLFTKYNKLNSEDVRLVFGFDS